VDPTWVAVTVKVPVCVAVQVLAIPGLLKAVVAGEVLIFQSKFPGGLVVKTEEQETQLVLGP